MVRGSARGAIFLDSARLESVLARMRGAEDGSVTAASVTAMSELAASVEGDARVSCGYHRGFGGRTVCEFALCFGAMVL